MTYIEKLFTSIHDAHIEYLDEHEIVGIYIYGGLMWPPKPLELIWKWEKE